MLYFLVGLVACMLENILLNSNNVMVALLAPITIIFLALDLFSV